MILFNVISFFVAIYEEIFMSQIDDGKKKKYPLKIDLHPIVSTSVDRSYQLNVRPAPRITQNNQPQTPPPNYNMLTPPPIYEDWFEEDE
jgi:hypothetical protein